MSKICIKCNKEMNESLFVLRKGGQIGNVCKECENKRKKEWYNANKEKIEQQRQQNAEQRKAYMKQWHEEHKEHEKVYREQNKDKLKEYSDNYYKENKDKIKKYYDNYNSLENVKERKRIWYDEHIEEKKEQDKIYNSREREKICSYCGNAFISTSSTKYCSDVCYRLGYKKLREKTYIEKYGYTHPYKNPEIKEKFRQTCISRYGVSTPFLTKECQEKNGNTISKVNINFSKILKEHNINFVTEFIIKGSSYSYDFFIPEINMLIEINPTYTHTVMGNHFNNWQYREKMEYYHLDKTNTAIDNGYHCINVWDWDFWHKIINLIKPKQKLYARKLQLKEISKQLANTFLDKYHIQGSCYGNKVNIGLFNDNELVQVMTFGKPRYNKNYQWELLRLCIDSDYVIVGGTEKLFKFFKINYKPNSIISYCDISKFSGDVYYRLGFNLKDVTMPQKIWSKDSQYITDNLLRQRGADQLIGTCDGKGTNNEEIMLREGWLPVYDCGQKVFEWYNLS